MLLLCASVSLCEARGYTAGLARTLWPGGLLWQGVTALLLSAIGLYAVVAGRCASSPMDSG